MRRRSRWRAKIGFRFWFFRFTMPAVSRMLCADRAALPSSPNEDIVTEDPIIADLRRRMDSAQDVLRKEFGGLRTGRASVNLLDSVHVEAYGNIMPLNQVGT